MNEFERSFYDDIREKKTTATGAHHMATHGKRSFAVHNQSDYLTTKEVKALSGEVHEFNLKQPMKYRQFQILDKDSQKLYLESLINEYGVNACALADMFGIDYHNVVNKLKQFGLYQPKSKMDFEKKERWQQFIAGDSIVSAPEDENRVKSITCDKVVTLGEKNERKASPCLYSAKVSIAGTDKEMLMDKLLTITDQILPAGRVLKVTLEVE